MLRLLSSTALLSAVLAVQPVAAASYIRYTATGTGSGSVFNSNGLVYAGLAQVRFGYSIILDPTPNTTLKTENGVTTYRQTDFAGTFSNAVVSGNTFAVTSGMPSAAGARANFTACFTAPTGGILPTGFRAVDASCGSFDYLNTFPGGGTSFTGTISGFTAEVIEGVPTGSGFPSFSFTPGVPEPSTWALMLAGFGMVGYSLRRRRVRHEAVTLAA